jgi:DNA recombination protein RmuC
MLIYSIIACALSAITLVLVVVFRPRPNNNLYALSTKMDELFKRLDNLTSNLKEDFKTSREENSGIAAQNRQELSATMQAFRQEMTETLRLITEQNRNGAEAINKTLEEKLSKLNEQAKADNIQMRDAVAASFKGFQETFDRNVESFNNLQREKFGQLEDKQMKLVETTEKKLEGIRETVEEKLQKTLQERLGQSFDMVSKQLSAVQQGLGEMQTLAQDVGGLKKVLSNVKMRGGFGEVQLQMLLEHILAPEQYDANVVTKKGSSERVEFAVKFPNKEGDRDHVWLPIDAKFPKDAYETLQIAYDANDPAAIEAAQKNLEGVIKKMARDICEKYIDAPNTTNFGIMFLPFEGLFAEVVRKASLLEDIQRNCNVIVTGPTTLAVILNSLQMGFRTLAIQKRSSEVWQVLSSVKKEFELFGGLLEKAQNNIQTGLNHLDDVVGKRTRAIQRKLRGVELLEDDKTPIELSAPDLLDEEE